jgi:phage tail sheath protein FI
VAGCLAAVAIASGAHGDATELAPAGLIAAGHPSGVGPLNRAVTRDEAERLVAHRVNTIRDFRMAGRGVRLWGIRTMSSDPEWQYVNVRRLGLFLERSLERGLQWVVFEPNNERTWTTVRAAVTDFLTARWRDGALMGRTADEAFFVRCDRSTMTQHDLDAGRLICLVGVAPVRPAEFVVIRIGLWTADKP